MTLVMTSLPLARVFQCLFTFVLVPPRADWRKSDSSVDGKPRELEVEFKFRDEVASSPSFSRPAARVPRTACSQATLVNYTCESCIKLASVQDATISTILQIAGPFLVIFFGDYNEHPATRPKVGLSISAVVVAGIATFFSAIN